MTKVLSNKRRMINCNTLIRIKTASEQLERKEDRSFLIVGVYAITLDSVAPVSIIKKSE